MRSARRTIAYVVGLAAGSILFSLGVSLAQSPLPDFEVTALSNPPAEVFPGDSFPLSVTVANTGDGVANPKLTAIPPLTQIVTKFYLVSGSTKKNLDGTQLIDLPVDPGQGGIRSAQDLMVSVYSDTAPGTYSLQACAEAGGDIAEESETNNCTNAGLVIVKQAPDLTIISVSVSPTTAGQGQPITVTDTVKNIGVVDQLPNDTTTTKYHLLSPVDDSRVIDLKLPSPTKPVPSLDSGDTHRETQTLTIRPETIPGQYKVQACADGLKTQREQDDQNNCWSSPGVITVTAQPDLVVTSISVQGAVQGAPVTVDVTDGVADPLTITVTVTNQGLAVAKPKSTVKFALLNLATNAEKNLNGTATVPENLAAGASITLTKTVTVYADTLFGSYAALVCADSAKGVVESSDGNNCSATDAAAAAVIVKGTAPCNCDLVVTAVPTPATPEGRQPGHVLPGDTLKLTATVKNLGSGEAPASSASFYLVSGSTKKNLKGTGLPVRNLVQGDFDTPAPVAFDVYSDTIPGVYTLQACADGPKSVITETAEGNNCANAGGTITVDKTPNLVVSSIGSPPATGSLNQEITVTNTVKNIGSAPAGHSSTKLYLVASTDGSRQDLKGSQSVPDLGVNQSFTAQSKVTIRPETVKGTYRAQACADAGTNGVKEVTESKEDDNCMTSSGTIRVTGPPDLVVTSVTVKNPPATIKLGGSLVISTGIKNIGEGDVPTAPLPTVRYWLANGDTVVKDLKTTYTFPALRSNSTTLLDNKSVSVHVDTPLGTYNIRVCVDAFDIVREESETNNCTNAPSGPITVTQ